MKFVSHQFHTGGCIINKETFEKCIFHSCTARFIIMVCEVHSTVSKVTGHWQGSGSNSPSLKFGIHMNSAQFVGSLTPHSAWQLSEAVFFFLSNGVTSFYHLTEGYFLSLLSKTPCQLSSLNSF